MMNISSVLGLFLCFIASAQCSIILDFARPSLGRAFWTVTAFDTKRQSLLHLETLPNTPFKRPLSGFIDSQVDKRGAQELSYIISSSDNNELVIEAGQAEQAPKSRTRYIIMSSAIMRAINLHDPEHNACLGKSFWTSKPIKERSPMWLHETIRGLGNKHANEAEFVVTLHDRPSKHVLSDLSNGNKGSFGELVTQMTMFSYGYDYLPSLYSGNRGLDGIFLSFSREHLVLSQSKLGNTNHMAGTVIQKELSEIEIAQRLALMGIYGSQEVRETQQLAYKFIQESPNKVYKLAQCLFNCGLADFVIKPFDKSKYPTDVAPMFKARSEDKIHGVTTTLGFFESTPLGQLKLALSAIDTTEIPLHELIDCLLTARGVDESNKAMFHHLLTLPGE